MSGLGCQVLLFLSLIYVEQQIYYKEQTLSACNFIIENDQFPAERYTCSTARAGSGGEKLSWRTCDILWQQTNIIVVRWRDQTVENLTLDPVGGWTEGQCCQFWLAVYLVGIKIHLVVCITGASWRSNTEMKMKMDPAV